MVLDPGEAAALGGTATLSTHPDGKPSRHLLLNIVAQGLAASAPFFTAAAFLALLFNMRAAITGNAAATVWQALIAMLVIGGVCLVAPVAWGLRRETVEMGRQLLRIGTGNKAIEIPWSAVRELRCTTVVAYMSRRMVVSRPAVIVTGDSGRYTMKWWRFPMEQQKQFFIFAASMVLPYRTPVVDDLHWLGADKASHPAVHSRWEREYRMLVKAGAILMLAGILMSLGFFANLALLGGIGLATIFMGMFTAVLGWAALSEEKKKKGQG